MTAKFSPDHHLKFLLGAALLAKLSQDKTPLTQARDATGQLLACGTARHIAADQALSR